MSILVMLLFLSLVFSIGGVLALSQSLRRGDADHADRLSLLPLESEKKAS